MSPRAELRRTLRARRAAHVRALTPAERAAAARAAADLLAVHVPPGAIVGSYAAMGDELDTAPLDALLAARGCALAFPRVVGDAPLTFHAWPRDALRPGFKSIAEPRADAPLVTPDVLIVPLLAVNAAGNRLGQGAGHYDRTLDRLRASGPLLAIGYAWDVQRVAHMPAEPWDEPLDALATPARFIRFRA